jgi:hypothetical protein
LVSLCKISKGNKISEKNKKKEQKKGAQPNWAAPGTQPARSAPKQTSARFPLSALLSFSFLFHFRADRWDPPVITHLCPKSTPEMNPKLPPLLLLIPPVSWP